MYPKSGVGNDNDETPEPHFLLEIKTRSIYQSTKAQGNRWGQTKVDGSFLQHISHFHRVLPRFAGVGCIWPDVPNDKGLPF